MSDTTKETKHGALAKGLRRGCSALLCAAHAAAESDHPELRKMGAEIAGAMPERLSAIKAAFPKAEPDGDEGEENKKVAAAVEALTGLEGEAAIGALYALSTRAQAQTDSGTASKEAERMALVERMVKVTRQVHPSDRGKFEKLSAEALAAFRINTPEGLYAQEQPEGAPHES